MRDFSILGVPWKRIKRRIKLMGGSYTHPDGTIEFDFEVAAGITPVDDAETRARKMAVYDAKLLRWRRLRGAALIAVAVGVLSHQPRLDAWGSVGLAVLVFFGLVHLFTD